jgi:multisubunit Na+/H+ antiporter MnhB subunit
MNSVILHTATRVLVSLLLLASLFLLWRGHNAPGGGFAGGLMAAAAIVLMAISMGPGATRQALRLDPQLFIAGGLAIAVAAGIIGLAAGDPVLTGQWVEIDWADHLSLGTPLLFDVGVYLVVVGVVLTIVLTLMEEDEG